ADEWAWRAGLIIGEHFILFSVDLVDHQHRTNEISLRVVEVERKSVPTAEHLGGFGDDTGGFDLGFGATEAAAERGEHFEFDLGFFARADVAGDECSARAQGRSELTEGTVEPFPRTALMVKTKDCCAIELFEFAFGFVAILRVDEIERV